MNLSNVLAQLIVPINLAIALLVAASICFFLRRRKFATFLLAFAFTWVFSWSLPATSLFFGSLLELRFHYLPADRNPEAEAIIVLGGHTAANRHNWFEPLDPKLAFSRVERAAELYHAKKAPIVIVSGAALDGGTSEAQGMARRLKQLNVPATAIILEESSHTTRENALYTNYFLNDLGIKNSLLVTSALHMPRALATFSKLTQHFTPAPVRPQIVRPKKESFSLWQPNWHTLNASRSIIKEYIGLFVYWIRGWA